MKKRHFIILGITFAIVISWFLFLVSPTIEIRNRILRAYDKSQVHLQDFRKIMIEAPEYFKSHHKLMMEKKHLTSLLYAKEDLMKLFDDLKAKAEKDKLQLMEIMPSVEELLLFNRQMPNEDEPQTLHIVVNLKGSLQRAGNFIQNIESENFYQGLDRCRISNYIEGMEYSSITYGFKAVLGNSRKTQ